MKRPPPTTDRAFVVRAAPFGESDTLLTLFALRSGIVTAIAPKGRSGSSRKSLALEPFHSLLVEFASGRGEIGSVRSSFMEVARGGLLEDTRMLEAAGTATRWLRALAPPRHPEPTLFANYESLLDRLLETQRSNAANSAIAISYALCAFGLTLLEQLGYGIELAACTRCQRGRPSGRSAYVLASAGGVVCESCRVGAASECAHVFGALLDSLSTLAPITPPDEFFEHLALLPAASQESADRLLAVIQESVNSCTRTLTGR